MSFIRFNPDAYKRGNIKIGSPWKKNKLFDKNEWEHRLNVLKNTILLNINANEIDDCNVTKLFYDS